MPIRRSPNGVRHIRPQPGRNRPEWVVAINRNARSQSVGTGGRNHPVRARAYELVGFTPDRGYNYIEINRTLRRMFPHIVADAIAGIVKFGGQVRKDPATDLLTVNDEFTASITIVRCRETAAGSCRWHIRFDTGLRPDITIALRMDRSNSAPLDYYLLPRIDMTGPRIRLAEHNGLWLDAYRFESLEALFELAARSKLMEIL